MLGRGSRSRTRRACGSPMSRRSGCPRGSRRSWRPIARGPSEANTGCFRLAMAQPIPPYLIALAVGDLAFQSLGPRTGVWAEPSVLKSAAFEFADVESMVTSIEKRLRSLSMGPL